MRVDDSKKEIVEIFNKCADSLNVVNTLSGLTIAKRELFKLNKVLNNKYSQLEEHEKKHCNLDKCKRKKYTTLKSQATEPLIPGMEDCYEETAKV